MRKADLYWIVGVWLGTSFLSDASLMTIQITARHLEVTDAFKNYVR